VPATHATDHGFRALAVGAAVALRAGVARQREPAADATHAIIDRAVRLNHRATGLVAEALHLRTQAQDMRREATLMRQLLAEMRASLRARDTG
jgi:hypothetical protein